MIKRAVVATVGLGVILCATLSAFGSIMEAFFEAPALEHLAEVLGIEKVAANASSFIVTAVCIWLSRSYVGSDQLPLVGMLLVVWGWSAAASLATWIALGGALEAIDETRRLPPEKWYKRACNLKAELGGCHA